ncbi:carbohydrate ABC transporter permease [Cytobacillus dafuensis]|uniref:Sugar ABC transporter permease n=1 Tax=Cytobacillus dafuensis TaxID=1742359 RepID=A0A5B8Z121_CYTDA|nr:sugar ABC transporter permease [Cytobacillus dafuensis]QED46501.1 sugar ABC transporter permease [Cytobacillus dafuensis]
MLEKLKPYLFLAPAIVLLLVFTVIPMVYTLYLSFFDWNMISPTKEFVGLDNYINILTNDTTKKVIFNTFFYIVVLILFNCVITYIFAFIIGYVVKRFKGFYKVAFFIPSVISLVVGSILFTWILNPISGPVAIIGEMFGFSIPNWSKTDGLVIIVLSLIVSWKVFGYNFIVLYASVVGVSKEIIEAARLDNISNFRIFLDIVLPMSSATGFYILILTIVQGLQYVFTPIKVITQGGPNYGSSNLIYQAYHEAFVVYKTGESAALAMITLLIFVILLLLEFLFVERRIYYENK